MDNGDLELEDFVDSLFDKDSFILELFSGTVLPVTHPNYYDNRLFIRLIQSIDINVSHAEIENNNYVITKEKIEIIKQFLGDNFKSLISIALKQGAEMYVGGGTSLSIKIKSVHIMIDCNNLIDDNKIYVKSIIEKIVNIIKD